MANKNYMPRIIDAKIDEYLNVFVDTQIEMHSKKSTLLRKLHDKMVDKIDETEQEETQIEE